MDMPQPAQTQPQQQGLAFSNPLASPTPASLEIVEAMVNGQQACIAVIRTPASITHVILNPQDCTQWGTVFTNAGKRAMTGLIIPSGAVPPIANGFKS